MACVQFLRGLVSHSSTSRSGAWYRQRLQEHAVHDGDHRGVEADAQGQGQHGDERKSRLAQQAAPGVAKVANEQVHGQVIQQEPEGVEECAAGAGQQAGTCLPGERAALLEPGGAVEQFRVPFPFEALA